MSPSGWFRRRSKAAGKAARKHLDQLPDGLWTKCSKCSEILFTRELHRNLMVCNKCGYHFKLSAEERILMMVDEGSFVEMDFDLATVNVIGFPGYESKIEKWQAQSGLNDGMVTGTCTIGGEPTIIAVADFGFMGGSMGSVYGEKITRCFERGIKECLPVVIVNSSGGARMWEGLISLMQMAKTSAAVAKFQEAGLLYVAIFADPTMAGVHASFAMLADIIIAEPGALIGLAGQRVAAQAQVIKEPPGYRLAEWQLEHGMVDMVLPRREIKDNLAKLLAFNARRK
ncbi:MAG TPA: acetyl-CoA carboxylase, carboxyltransferase subunit beta [Armatimonadota bacterium]|jgi:acetyl-CoA carboxylase carboxyl transferase subunit beta